MRSFLVFTAGIYDSIWQPSHKYELKCMWVQCLHHPSARMLPMVHGQSEKETSTWNCQLATSLKSNTTKTDSMNQLLRPHFWLNAWDLPSQIIRSPVPSARQSCCGRGEPQMFFCERPETVGWIHTLHPFLQPKRLRVPQVYHSITYVTYIKYINNIYIYVYIYI